MSYVTTSSVAKSVDCRHDAIEQVPQGLDIYISPSNASDKMLTMHKCI